MIKKGNLFHLIYIKENCELAIKLYRRLFPRMIFYRHSMAKYACVRFLEVIGEASKNLTNDFRDKHPELNWKAAHRKCVIKLAHDYAGTDFLLSFGKLSPTFCQTF